MNVLDLFCGWKGWSAPWAAAGHDVVSLDIDPAFSPTIAADILDVTVADLRREFRDPNDRLACLASPPCECFSVASIGASWTGGRRAYVPKTDKARNAVAVVEKTVALIEEMVGTDDVAVIENPRGVLRKLGIIPVDPVTVWYCMYESVPGQPADRAKPTDLWGMPFPEGWQPRMPCHNQRPDHPADCLCRNHHGACRGARTGTQGRQTYAHRSEIPEELALSIMEATI